MYSGQQLIIAFGSDSNRGLGVLLADQARREPAASHGSLLTSKPVSVFARSVIIAEAAVAVLDCCFY